MLHEDDLESFDGFTEVKPKVTKDSLWKYGLTRDDVEAMIRDQDNRCAICGNPPRTDVPACDRVLHIDHCHKTKIVRGLLCGDCNRGLGMFKDDPAILEKARDYLVLRST